GNRQEYNADINSRWATWESWDTGGLNHLLEILHLTAGTHITITLSQSGGSAPHIYGNWVIYTKEENPSNYDVWLYAIASSQSTPLITGTKRQIATDIYDTLVVYQEDTYPSSPGFDTIWVYDISTENAVLLFDELISSIDVLNNIQIHNGLAYWIIKDGSGQTHIYGAKQLPLQVFLPRISH